RTPNDADAARAFSSALFGWALEGPPVPARGTFTVCTVGGEPVAGIPGSTDMAPPRWNNYVTVAGADETAAKAAELGAELIEQPFDIPGAGRLLLFADPAGATLCAWEAREMIGAGRVNEPGCLAWNELHTP